VNLINVYKFTKETLAQDLALTGSAHL